jgi:hypothetical protein
MLARNGATHARGNSIQIAIVDCMHYLDNHLHNGFGELKSLLVAIHLHKLLEWSHLRDRDALATSKTVSECGIVQTKRWQSPRGNV